MSKYLSLMFARKHFIFFLIAALALFSVANQIFLPLVINGYPPATATATNPPATATATNLPPTDTPAPTATIFFPTVTATNPPPGPCNCTGPDLNCTDFATHASAQACFSYCRDRGFGDVFNLDSDGDGLACESLP